MRRHGHSHLTLMCFAVMMGAAAVAQSMTLKSHRLAGRSYVTVSDLASYYHLGRGARDGDKRVEYKTATVSLVVEADSREIQLNGVGHWLSAPVRSARGEFWVTPLDVLKTIDPILGRGKTHVTLPVYTVVIDPGHGGADEGTHGAHSREKDMTLDLAKRVERDLAGVRVIRVVMTRTGDVTTPLDQRVELCRSERADFYLSLHFNSGGTADGIETYCVPPAGAPTTAHAPYEGERESAAEQGPVPNNRFDEQNVWLAHCIQRSLLQAAHATDRGVRRARFYVLRNATCPAILVEAGFLSNRTEEGKILTPEYRDVLAQAIAEGILDYAGRQTSESKM